MAGSLKHHKALGKRPRVDHQSNPTHPHPHSQLQLTGLGNALSSLEVVPWSDPVVFLQGAQTLRVQS